MSILIKGMEMPKNCHECYFSAPYFCRLLNREIVSPRYSPRPSDCPLVPVPPHGDLIDRDALMMHKGNCYDADGHLLYAVGTGNILRAPTIIPADPAEEGE